MSISHCFSRSYIFTYVLLSLKTRKISKFKRYWNSKKEFLKWYIKYSNHSVYFSNVLLIHFTILEDKFWECTFHMSWYIFMNHLSYWWIGFKVDILNMNDIFNFFREIVVNITWTCPNMSITNKQSKIIIVTNWLLISSITKNINFIRRLYTQISSNF